MIPKSGELQGVFGVDSYFGVKNFSDEKKRFFLLLRKIPPKTARTSKFCNIITRQWIKLFNSVKKVGGKGGGGGSKF